MVSRRAARALSLLYTDSCSVFGFRPVKLPNGSLTSEEFPLYSDIPCRISYKSSPYSAAPGPNSPVRSVVTLFLPPDIQVEPGSKVSVTRDGRTSDYTSSGFPEIYRSHQEIVLSQAANA